MTDTCEYAWAALAEAEPWHFWFQARRALIQWMVARYCPDARRVLDVGCGTGFVLAGLQRPGVLLAGCDAAADAVRIARRRSGLRIVQSDALALGLGGPFDAALALDVLEHIEHDDVALREVYRVLRPGGTLILSVPQHTWCWSVVDERSGHVRRYSREGLRHVLTAAGFSIAYATSAFMTTLPLVYASRWRRRHREYDPSAELRPSPRINALLGMLIRPEWAALRAGVSLPFGGSLLMVARRVA